MRGGVSDDDVSSIMQADSLYTWDDYTANVAGSTFFCLGGIAAAMIALICAIFIIANADDLFRSKFE